MTRSFVVLLAAAATAAGLCVGTRGEEAKLTARDVATKSFNRVGYKHDECTALRMRLVNREGKVREREFVRYQTKGQQGKSTLMKFSYPNEIRDTGTLNVEQQGSDDIQHLYLPAVSKLRRVSAKSDSWMGTDFNFEDIMETKFDNFNYENLREDRFDGFDCYVYDKTPKKTADSIYSKQIDWVRKEGFLPVKTLYYDKAGKELKVLEFTDLRDSNIPGAKYAWTISVRSLQEAHRTEIIRQWIFLDTNMSEDLTTTRQLEKSIKFYSHPEKLWEIWDETRKKETFEKIDGKAGDAKPPPAGK